MKVDFKTINADFFQKKLSLEVCKIAKKAQEIFNEIKKFSLKVLTLTGLIKLKMEPNPKNLLSFFNKHFPNVFIVGNPECAVTKEGSLALQELGIAHQIKKQCDKAEVPFEVWSHLDSEIDPKLKSSIIQKIQKGLPLTKEEEKGKSHLMGASACFLTHRRAILDTISKYDACVSELEQLQKNPSDNQDRIKLLQAQKETLSTICVFEHNTRFGFVLKNNQIQLDDHLKTICQKSLESLPSNWEYLSLGVSELNTSLNKPSAHIPGTQTITKDDLLVHPGLGMSTKGYAFSHRSYADLKVLFESVTEKKATKTFYPIDVEFQRLSAAQEKQGRLYHIAIATSLIYRKCSPSFHKEPNSGSYADSHFGLHIYNPSLAPRCVVTCCGSRHTLPQKTLVDKIYTCFKELKTRFFPLKAKTT